MGATVSGTDKIRKTIGIFRVIIRILECALYLDAIAFTFKLHRGHQRIPIFMQVVQERRQTVFIAECLNLRLLPSGVFYNDRNAGQQKCLFPGPFRNHIKFEFRRGKDFRVRFERDFGTGTVRIAELFELADLFVTVIKPQTNQLSIMCNFCDIEVNVLSWGSEVVEIPYYSEIDGKTHRYILDFLIIVRKIDGTLGKWAIEVKPNSQTAYLDKMGNVIYPPAPKKKTQKSLAKWQEKCQVIRRNSEKWDAAKRWAAKRGFKFAVKTENEIFGLAGEKGRV